MTKNLDELAKYRDAFLLAEVAAWLHMFGKLHEKFLEGQYRMDSKIPEDAPDSLKTLLTDTWTGKKWEELEQSINDFRAAGLTIHDLIKHHKPTREHPISNETKGFIQLLADAHGRGSGIEKGVLGSTKFLEAHKNPVYLSTPFGNEKDIKPSDIATAKAALYANLQAFLGYLKDNPNLSESIWQNFLRYFRYVIEQCFHITVAETRRPLNDIRLLDQTSMSVAFFKAALAQNILQGEWKDAYVKLEEDEDERNVEDQYRWRLLRIGLDGFTFWATSTRIGDNLARKNCIEQALDEVQTLLEVTYPLGTEIYRDQNGSVFLVPDVSKIEDLPVSNEANQLLKDRIQAIAKAEGKDKLSGEALFTITLLEVGTRETLQFGKMVATPLPSPKPSIDWLKHQWEGKAKDICTVCRLRPQGPDKKSSDRKVCSVCEKRRLDRSKQWIQDLSTTIWADEVADNNGQLALLVANFGINNWLSGQTFNTLVSFDPQKRWLDSKHTKFFDLSILIKNIEQALTLHQEFDDSNLLGQLIKWRDGLNKVEDYYDHYINQTGLQKSSTARTAELLVLYLLRHPPSFARISRVWKTTQQFFQEVAQDFTTTVGKVGTRIKLVQDAFIANTGERDTLGISHTYEIKLAAIRCSITYSGNGEFLTVENLLRVAMLLDAPKEYQRDYAKATEYVQMQVQQQGPFQIEEPTGYGNVNKPLGTLYVKSATIVQTPYTPAIPLLTEPQTFMALVPANKALCVAHAMQQKYYQEMNKVQNKLPLSIGIVFAGRRTPLPALLSAGQRMLKQPNTVESWKITEDPSKNLSNEVTLRLKRKDHELHITTSTVMGDNSTPDVWYPYWQVHNIKPLERTRQFTGADGKEWVHINDLRKDDEVSLASSRFDFEFLDTAARRFEVSYEKNERSDNYNKRKGSQHLRRPYYLEELADFNTLWEILRKRLATTQIENLIGLIETKREEWKIDQDNDVFQQVVCNILKNAHWKERPDDPQMQKLYQAAISGQLVDVTELYISILKQKTQVDLEEEASDNSN